MRPWRALALSVHVVASVALLFLRRVAAPTRLSAVSVLVGIFLGLLARSITSSPSAASPVNCIPVDNGFHHHLYSAVRMEPENFCVWQPEAGTLTRPELLALVRGTLYMDNTAEDWDLIHGGRVIFAGDGRPCDDFGEWWLQSYFEIQVIESNTWCLLHGRGEASCAVDTARVYNSATGHYEIKNAMVALHTDHIEHPNVNRRRHVINHEFGHLLDLANGWCPAPGPTDFSVMHSGYIDARCDYVTWPTDDDRSAAVSCMAWGSSGHGSSGRAWGAGW